MDCNKIISELLRNKDIFRSLLIGLPIEQYKWKPSHDKWSLLEISCHLYDEEREDFRTRTKYVLELPEHPLPTFDPIKWVEERSYIQQDFNSMTAKFIMERELSVEWLQSLANPNWENAYEHPKFGKMTAKMFLTNWLAHDYLHIRQIISVKFDYFKQISNESFAYAGIW